MTNRKIRDNISDRKAVELLVREIANIVDKKLSDFCCDRTFKSIIQKVNHDGTYQIIYENKPYNVRNALRTELKVGQMVWVKIPSGNFNEKHICGIVK